MALGSLTEVQNQLLIAKGLGYITQQQTDNLISDSIIIHKMTNGLIKSAASRIDT